MKQQISLVAGTAFLISASLASAQAPSRDFPTATDPDSTPPAAISPRTGTTDRSPAPTLPELGTADPIATGQAPSISEKVQPEMDSVGGPKPPPGSEKK